MLILSFHISFDEFSSVSQSLHLSIPSSRVSQPMNLSIFVGRTRETIGWSEPGFTRLRRIDTFTTQPFSREISMVDKRALAFPRNKKNLEIQRITLLSIFIFNLLLNLNFIIEKVSLILIFNIRKRNETMIIPFQTNSL